MIPQETIISYELICKNFLLSLSTEEIIEKQQKAKVFPHHPFVFLLTPTSQHPSTPHPRQ